MIGIIGAMDIEIEGFKKEMTQTTLVGVGPFAFFRGKISDKDVVVCVSGIGKVCAAACTAALLQAFPAVQLVINSGVAGGLLARKGMKPGDLVVAEGVLQHDVDLTIFGYQPAQLPDSPQVFPCDPKAVDAIDGLARELFDIGVFRGVVASGDQFISDTETSLRLNSTFGAAAAEMEGGSIGQVCHMFGTPFAVIRFISDCADGEAGGDFESFKQTAADGAIALASAYVARYG